MSGKIVGQAAIQRLAQLAAMGAPAPSVRSATVDLIGTWKSSGVALSALRDRLLELQVSVDLGVQEAEDFTALADTDTDRRTAVAQIDALRAIRQELDTELDYLFVRPNFSG